LGPGRDVPDHWLEELDKIVGLLRDAPDEELARRVYLENPWLTVTAKVLSFVSGTPTDIAVLPTVGV
jgi:hypothetical protein